MSGVKRHFLSFVAVVTPLRGVSACSHAVRRWRDALRRVRAALPTLVWLGIHAWQSSVQHDGPERAIHINSRAAARIADQKRTGVSLPARRLRRVVMLVAVFCPAMR
jgi:hypothetical protein